MKLVHWQFSTARMALGGAAVRPDPSSIYQNVTAHPSTASVAIAVFLYNGPLLCGFNVGITGLTTARRHNHHLSVEVAGSTLGRHCTR